MSLFPDDPTLEQILARLPSAGGRLDTALCEIMRLLQAKLPEVIDYINGDADFDLKLRPVEGFYMAGEKVEDKMPLVIISASIQSQVEGGRGTQDNLHVQVSTLFPKTFNLNDLLNCWALSQIQWAILSCVQNKRKDPDGRLVWNMLLKSGIEFEGSYPSLVGTTLHLQVEQHRGGNYWKKTTT